VLFIHVSLHLVIRFHYPKYNPPFSWVFICLIRASRRGKNLSPISDRLQCLWGQKKRSASGTVSGCSALIWRSRSFLYRKPVALDVQAGTGHLWFDECFLSWRFKAPSVEKLSLQVLQVSDEGPGACWGGRPGNGAWNPWGSWFSEAFSEGALEE